MDLRYDDEKHLYWIDGNLVPGVTTLLRARNQPWLMPWGIKMTSEAVREAWTPDTPFTREEIDGIIRAAKSAHRKKSDKGKSSGTTVHDLIQKFWAEEVPDEPEGLDEGEMNSWKAFLAFVKDYKPSPLHVEHVVGSAKHRYAGKVDFIGHLNGDREIPWTNDYKTSTVLGEDVKLQTAGYRNAFSEMGGGETRRGAVHLPKTGAPYYFWDIEALGEYEFDLSCFLALKTVHMWDTHQQTLKQEAKHGKSA